MPYFPPASSGSGTVTALSSADNSLTISNPTTTPDAIINSNWLNGSAIINGYITAVATTDQLFILIKDINGNDPSASSPVKIVFRNSTLTTPSYTVITLTASCSFVLSDGSTLGCVNAINRLWVVGINNSGTFYLGVVNCCSHNGDYSIFPLRNDSLVSTVAEGTAGAADSSKVIYAIDTLSNKPMAILGYIDVEDTSDGNWTSPLKIQQFSYGISLPNQVIQQKYVETNSNVNITDQTFLDDTIQQKTEGEVLFSVAFTPIFANSLVKFTLNINFGSSALCYVVCSLFINDENNATKTAWTECTYNVSRINDIWFLPASTTSERTYKIIIGPDRGANLAINGANSSRFMGGTMYTSFLIEEIAT